MERILLKFIVILPILFTIDCQSSINNEQSESEPDYNIPILWTSDVSRPFNRSTAIDDNSFYIYEYQKNNFNSIKLHKIDPLTGKTIWSTSWINNISLTQPIISDNFIYVCSENGEIFCFYKEDGIQLSRIKITYNNLNDNDIWITSPYVLGN